jgi:hypothetical protein
MLTKTELKDMKIKRVGDRVYMNELIRILKKKMKMHERNEIFWKAGKLLGPASARRSGVTSASVS